MDIDFAFLCDHANATGGKLDAIGIGIDTLFATKLPHAQPQLFFVAQLRAQITEEGIHPLKLNLIDADGGSVVSVSGQANVGRPQRGTEAVARILLRLVNVSFKAEGDYSFRLVLDNQEAVRIPLRVSLRPQAESTAPG